MPPVAHVKPAHISQGLNQSHLAHAVPGLELIPGRSFTLPSDPHAVKTVAQSVHQLFGDPRASHGPAHPVGAKPKPHPEPPDDQTILGRSGPAQLHHLMTHYGPSFVQDLVAVPLPAYAHRPPAWHGLNQLYGRTAPPDDFRRIPGRSSVG